MFNIRFDPNHDRHRNRIIIEGPYELVSTWMGDELGSSPKKASFYIDGLRAVLDGSEPSFELGGNAFILVADKEWTTLSNDFALSKPSIRVPTASLLDAVEKWRAYLINRGINPEQ